jgi:hydrogenase-1 operon protein HyaE
VDVVRKATVDDFLARNPRALLFFLGDRGEGLDVAVVVRELLASYRGRLSVGLVDRRDEAVLMAQYGVVVTPAVVYLRDGQPAELVARMRDWPVFAQAADRLLAPAGSAAATLPGGNA